jgi:hypothetical protein
MITFMYGIVGKVCDCPSASLLSTQLRGLANDLFANSLAVGYASKMHSTPIAEYLVGVVDRLHLKADLARPIAEKLLVRNPPISTALDL